MNIREYLKTNALVFDGGMGTCYSAHTGRSESGCEFANLSHPEVIAEIHREYMEAGAQALKTNTFGANRDTCQGDGALLRRVLTAGWQLAVQAAEGRAYVFADIGPVVGGNVEDAEAAYREIVDVFLELGAEHFLFETNSDDIALAEIAGEIKRKRPEAFILVSFAPRLDGYTREGRRVEELLRHMTDCGQVDAVGLNCVMGARHMRQLIQTLPAQTLPLSVMPNAGYPVVLNHRTFYEGDPRYFAAQIAALASGRVGIVGGCCGTTPAHIEAICEALKKQNVAADAETIPEKPAVTEAAPVQNHILEKLQAGKRVIAVELDPPKTANSSVFMEGARALQAAGIDALTIADCPIACARMDSSLLACKLKRELALDVIPHMTCRDRNLNATKALLLGLYSEGVRNILTVTGDPVPTAERDEVKSVYQFNSRKMAHYIRDLGEREFPEPMQIFGALNLNARNFDVQLRIAAEKEENGISGFLTQPVLTPEAFENLKRARSTLHSWILGGIFPVVSAKNARFLDSEVNGINVDPALIILYEGKDREAGEALALTVSTEIAGRIAPYVDGYYLVTPFNRIHLMEQLVERLRTLE